MKKYSWHFAAFLMLMVQSIAVSHGESVSGQNLAAALRTGGYVILMRHASSPRDPPDAAAANPDNPNRERQLDETGRSSSAAFGEALRHLGIPIGQVLVSPTCRALETIRFAKLGTATPIPQLGDFGQSMVSDQSGARGAWLRAKVAEPPAPGKNIFIVTHFPNIKEAYPQESTDLADGEALILHPDSHGGAAVVSRVKIGEWADLAATR